MLRRLALPLAVAVVLAGCSGKQVPAAPVGFSTLLWCSLDSTSEVRFGERVRDPFRWLELGARSAVRDWSGDENAAARTFLDRMPVRAAVEERLRAVVSSGYTGSPAQHGDLLFYTRRNSGQERAALYARNGEKERLILDPNSWPPDRHENLIALSISADGRRVGYGVSTNNDSEFTFRVLDVNTGITSASDTISGLHDTSPSWSSSGDGFYYRWTPKDHDIPLSDLPGRVQVKFHRIGTDPGRDEIVRGATGDPRITEYPVATRDGHWLILSVQHGFTRQDILVRDLRQPNSPWVPIVEGRDAWSEVLEADDTFFLKTNEGAANGRIFTIFPNKYERQQWIEIVPERKDAVLRKFVLVKDGMMLTLEKDATSFLELRDRHGRGPRLVPVPGVGAITDVSGSPDRDVGYFDFSSYTYPDEVRSVSWTSGETEVFARTSAPVDSERYIVEQVFYSTSDERRVPMFLVHRKDVTANGQVPTIVSGYGGFGVSVDTEFDPSLFGWLDQGGLYVDVVLRGGGEYGEDWHRAGMGGRKQRVFDDFVDASKDLIRRGWTRSEYLAAKGGSNGGLLVAAVITQHPELFRVALIRSPLTDMIRFPLFGDGKQWTEEYGSPDVAADFRALLAYSPYHHVSSGVQYPSVLVQTGDADDLVDGLHARKFVAALQCSGTQRPALLTVQENSGHGGGGSVSADLVANADAYAFALNEIRKGLGEAPAVAR